MRLRFWFRLWQDGPTERIREWAFRHWMAYQWVKPTKKVVYRPEEETGVDDPRLEVSR